jgi:FAD/FMN-containing dehydrogenase
VVVNDIHSQLNATRVAQIERPGSVDEVVRLVRAARADGRAVSIAGGRHAMGGQQFGEGTVHVDTTGLTRIIRLDAERGQVEAEAGIQWPALIEGGLAAQRGAARPWGIVQKQTGADRLSLGGSLAANVHGRGLTFRPFVQDVESFTLVDAEGRVRRCTRTENAELFRLAIGGYGLFGVVTAITLRLAPRRKIERLVEVIDLETLGSRFEERIAAGFLFGDFQFSTDEKSPEFLRRGVFSCYRPIDDAREVPAVQRELGLGDWQRLLHLSHADKRGAFAAYSGYYLGTSGQLYWSDTHQLSLYVDDYHAALDREMGARERATEMITEIYVPRDALVAFMGDVADDARAHGINIVYGTIRLIERDEETFLAWARQPYACVIFNLHVVHTADGLARATADFRRLIDRARSYGGSYYLTYHRWATREQVQACYPQFAEFLHLKRRYDPAERFQSEWYRHYRVMFADAL